MRSLDPSSRAHYLKHGYVPSPGTGGSRSAASSKQRQQQSLAGAMRLDQASNTGQTWSMRQVMDWNWLLHDRGEGSVGRVVDDLPQSITQAAACRSSGSIIDGTRGGCLLL